MGEINKKRIFTDEEHLEPISKMVRGDKKEEEGDMDYKVGISQMEEIESGSESFAAMQVLRFKSGRIDNFWE